MSNVKTINLTGGETKVDFGQKFMCFWVQNLGSEDVYASPEAGAKPETDGVIVIGAGASARVSAADRSQISTLYLTGSGKAQIVGCYSVHSPFMRKKKGGDDSDYITLVDMPLNGSFDGFGYTIINKQTYADNAFTDDGYALSASNDKASWFVIKIDNYVPVDTLIIEMDVFLIQNGTYNMYLFGLCTNGYYQRTIMRNFSSGSLALYTRSTYSMVPITVDEWHHITVKIYNNFNFVDMQVDDGNVVTKDVSGQSFTPINGQFVIGNTMNSGTYGNNAPMFFNGRIKNIKIKTPKEALL